MPNIFSPNGDGENEGFTVFAEWSGVRSVKTLQIFSRWGEQIFVRENFPPNDPALGWDGRFKGVEMNPGVFVYYALVELVNGQEVVYKGDVTLMR
ncbi:MAG: gliding motility-associated C-terminal domain-containing protein [Chitinophagales bacterium]|nr:gliding motility-associated C-terminal domain-containing protein [Chitinophagales bacterium]